MRILAFSDLHRDLDQAARLVERSSDADVLIAAGDFASVHEGLEEAIGALSAITTPTVLVPGNNETEDALRAACDGWDAATVLHGESTEIDGTPVLRARRRDPDHPLGLELRPRRGPGGREARGCPEGAVLVVHSPPKGYCDTSSAGDHLGSQAILEAIEAKRPPLAVCGHIHESWGAESEVGPTRVLNLGPAGTPIELGA